MTKQQDEVRVGVVIEALPNTMFRLEMEDGNEHIAYLGGKMKLHRIRVLVGDKVEVQMDPYGGKGRIVKRL
jgi:translation initiation factor IF-1